MAAARARGRKGGRPKGLSQKAKNTAIVAEQLYKQQQLSVREICVQLSISKASLYKYLRYQGVEVSNYRKDS